MIGINKITAIRSDNSRVVAIITVAPVRKGTRVHPDYWGTDGENPRTIISKLSITVGQDTVHIPWAAYGDLGEPNAISMMAGKSARLHIRGGDAAGSYDAYLDILGN